MKSFLRLGTQLFAFALVVVIMAVFGVGFGFAEDPKPKPKILFLTHSQGFKHSSLPLAEKTVTELGQSSALFEAVTLKGYEQDRDKIDLSMINAEYLKQFAAVMFFTTGELPLDDSQKKALIDFVEGGGAWLGSHSATDTFYTWPDYPVKLAGAWFKTHGPNDKPLVLKVEDKNHPATKMLGDSLTIADEFYQFRPGSFDRNRVHVLLSVDNEKSDLAPQRMDPKEYYPIAWCAELGKGKTFYTALGHREDMWTNPIFQQHLLGGIKWVLNLEPGAPSKAKE